MAIDPLDSRTFENISPEKFRAYLAALPADEITVAPSDANNGQGRYGDYLMGYSYDGTSNLTITGITKDFFSAPWSVVFDRIAEHLTS